MNPGRVPAARLSTRRSIDPTLQRGYFLGYPIPVESLPSFQTLPAQETFHRCQIGVRVVDRLSPLHHSTIQREDAKRGCRRWESSSAFPVGLVGGREVFLED